MKVDDISNQGILRITGETDRTEVASILYKNGYTVSPIRFKKNGRTYEYALKYSKELQDIDTEDK